MIGERSKALLSAAATIYATKGDWVNHAGAVEDAYALLAEIERREKANLSPREAK